MATLIHSTPSNTIPSLQVQRMKLDTEAAMLKLDQILRASELSLSVVAALPGLALTWGIFTACIRCISKIHS